MKSTPGKPQIRPTVQSARVEDQRIGSALRARRLRRRLRQVDVAAAAGIPRGVVMRIEAGRLDDVSFGHVRRLARALDAGFEGLIRWRGADLDRLVNRGHALMHEAMFRWLRETGEWFALPEVSFARNGERGVIDVVAWHAASRILLVIELKTRIVNDLMATMDVRRRVAWQIAQEHGWDPVAVGVWVVVAPGRSNTRALADHATVLRAKFPADGRSMRRWLAKPAGDIAGLSFMPEVRVADLGRDPTTPRRVRRPSRSVNRAHRPTSGHREPRIGVTFGA
jgi:transcriptional regulator with XRE-family HTH domain